MHETLRSLIAGVAAGAADGAAALRDTGVTLELDMYSVEATVDSEGRPAGAIVRVDFVLSVPPQS